MLRLRIGGKTNASILSLFKKSVACRPCNWNTKSTDI